VAVQGTHKLVVMGRINFEDHVLLKKWQVDEKMNVMGEMFKDKKKWGNY
jgi:predicted transcriptional regulator with HTH domain